jgi:hypothetical protein
MVMKSIALTLMLLGASGPVLAKQAPQHAPQVRAKPKPSDAQPAKPAQEAEPTSATSGCSMMLREIAEFTPLPDRAGPGECGAADRVQLDAIKMPDGSRVAMTPPATLRCAMAESIAEWVRSDLGKAAKDHGSALKAVVGSGSYDCRPRNGIKGAKISEHGRGNAMDIAVLKLANGAVIDLTRDTDPKAFRDTARSSACSRFTTVLGPGADAHHERHIHVDLAARNRGHRLCQWDVRDAPVVAAARPAATAAAAPRTSGSAKPSPSLLRMLAAEVGAQAIAATVQPQGKAAVPLPLRRPFELVFAMRKSSVR